MALDVKALLYSVIEEIGKERILRDLASEIQLSKIYIEEILQKCKSKMNSADEEILAALCEALLHFMLSVCLLPSERKLHFDACEINIIIPSLRILMKNPEKSLLIQVVRKGEVEQKIKDATSMQPKKENIWLVSAEPLNARYRNYTLATKGLPLSAIISDINSFIVKNDVKSLKFLPG